MDFKIGKQQLPTKYTLKELNDMINQNISQTEEEKIEEVVNITESKMKDTYTKAKTPVRIQYKDNDGTVIIKGNDIFPSHNEELIDIELNDRLKTEEILVNESEEKEELKKAV